MSRGWTYVAGDWWINCDVCARKIKASKSKHRWDGYIVCPEDYEERHSLDFLRVKPDKLTVPFIRLPVEDFVGVCDVLGLSDIADMAVAGCSITENDEVSLELLQGLES
jgi:hypothetical protein